MPYRGAASTYWADATFSENLPLGFELPLRGHDHAEVQPDGVDQYLGLQLGGYFAPGFRLPHRHTPRFLA